LNATNYASPYTDGILSASDFNKLISNSGKITYKGNHFNMLNPIQLDNIEVIMYNKGFKFKPIYNDFKGLFVNHSYNNFNTASITSYKNYSFEKSKYFEMFSVSM